MRGSQAGVAGRASAGPAGGRRAGNTQQQGCTAAAAYPFSLAGHPARILLARLQVGCVCSRGRAQCSVVRSSWAAARWLVVCTAACTTACCVSRLVTSKAREPHSRIMRDWLPAAGAPETCDNGARHSTAGGVHVHSCDCHAPQRSIAAGTDGVHDRSCGHWWRVARVSRRSGHARHWRRISLCRASATRAGGRCGGLHTCHAAARTRGLQMTADSTPAHANTHTSNSCAGVELLPLVLLAAMCREADGSGRPSDTPATADAGGAAGAGVSDGLLLPPPVGRCHYAAATRCTRAALARPAGRQAPAAAAAWATSCRGVWPLLGQLCMQGDMVAGK